MSTLFISHSSEDNARAKRIAQRLAESDHESIFLDCDPKQGIDAGRKWEKTLYRKIRACRAVIAVCSESSLRSRWCFAEITQARALGKHVFPVLIDRVELHALLSDTQAIDLTRDWNGGMDRLLGGLGRAGIAGDFPWEPDGDRPPYPGFLAFEEEDAAVYFGRSTEIGESLDLLNGMRRRGGSNLAMILGSSGSGKSSLVRAGVYPRLRRDPEHWLLLDPFRPRANPLSELLVVILKAFRRVAPHASSWRDLKARLESEKAPQEILGDVLSDLRLASEHPEATPLLFIDQFEELLGHRSTHPAHRFLKMIAAAVADADSPLVILGTMRSDSLGAFQEESALEHLRFESVSLGPMAQDDLVKIIVEPARVDGLRLGKTEEERQQLIACLLEDTQRADALPLLAYTLRILHEDYGDDRLIELREYEELGRIDQAVAKVAESIVEDLEDSELLDLRAAFLRLVRIDEESGRPLRRPATWDEIPPAAHPILERMRDEGRLLMASGDEEKRTIEVAHEALFRRWTRLKNWLDEDHEALLTQARIERSARRWDEDGRKDAYLWRGAPLVRAEELQRRDWSWGDPGSDSARLIQEFLRESRTIVDAERAHEVERLRLRAWLRTGGSATATVLVILGVLFVLDRLRLVDELTLKHWDQAEELRWTDPIGAAHRSAQALATARKGELVASLRVEYANHGSDELRLLDVLPAAGAVRGARFTPNSRKILVWDDRGVVSLWNLITQERLEFSGFDQGGEIFGAELDEKRSRVLAWTRNEVLSWHSETRKQVEPGFEIPEARWLRKIQLAPRGDRLLVVDSPLMTSEPDQAGDRITVFDAATSEKLTRPPLRISDAVIQDARFSSSGNRIIGWTTEGRMEVWTPHGRSIGAVELGAGAQGAMLDDPETVEGTPREWSLLTWGEDGVVRRWLLGIGEPGLLESARLDPSWAGIRIPPEVPDRRLRDVRTIHGGQRLLTLSSDGVARLWDAGSGELLGAGGGPLVPAARFDRSGELLLSWSRDGTARVWEIHFHGPRVWTLVHPGLLDASFSRDGELTATVGGPAVRVWGSDGEQLGAPIEHGAGSCRPRNAETGWVVGARFARKSEMLLTWTKEGAICLWRLDAHGIALHAEAATCPEAPSTATGLSCHRRGVAGARFDEREERILSFSEDGTAKLWAVPAAPTAGPGTTLALESIATLAHHGSRPGEDADEVPWVEDARFDEGPSGIRALFGRGSRGVWTRTEFDEISFWSRGRADWARSATQRRSKTGKRLSMLHPQGLGAFWDSQPSLVRRDGDLRPLVMDGHLLGRSRFHGEHLVGWTDKREAIVWDLAATAQVRLQHERRIVGAEISEDGRRIVTWDEKQLHLWDRNGRKVHSIQRAGVADARLLAGGRRLLLWTGDRVIELWDLEALRQIFTTGGWLSEAGRTGVEARVGPHEDRVLVWTRGEGSAALLSLVGDRELSPEDYPLKTAALTGMEFDPRTQKLRVLDRDSWLERRDLFSRASKSASSDGGVPH